MSSGYDIAQICLNGHVANSATIDFPQFNQKFCDECGEPTIRECPQCKSPIRGAYRDSLMVHYTAPHFCINCGSPFPWTESRLRTAHDLARELDGLSGEERAILEKSIDDLIKESPSTTLAATRFKRIVAKAGQAAASMFREILTDILSESARKMLYP
jgi:hypothetical protein